MLFGYVFNISVVSAFINVFLSLKLTQVGHYVLGLLIPLWIAAVLIIIMRIPALRALGGRLIMKFAGSIAKGDSANTVMLIDHIGKGPIAQVTLLNVPESLKGKKLFESGLKEENDFRREGAFRVTRQSRKPSL